MNRFKVNDKVTVMHKSWSQWLNVVREVKASCFDNDGNVDVWKILGIDCKIPISIVGYTDATANTLIQNVRTSQIYGINACNLKPVPTITVRFYSNGQDITGGMSKQSKQEVLKANDY